MNLHHFDDECPRCHGNGEFEVGTVRDSFGNWDTETVRCDCGEGVECLEGPEGCSGDVEMRWPGYGDRLWPRCERHGLERQEREALNIERNQPDSACAPAGFDPLDAGERWTDD